MKFFETEQKTTHDLIQKLEELFGYKIPKEYKDHLLEYNGGRCDPNIFYFKENDKLTSSDIDWFLALYNGKVDSIIKYLNDFKDRIPKYFMPIAHDSGGNLVCISSDDNDFGKIYFWNHEFNSEGKNDIWLISESFNEFIFNLKQK